MAYMKERWCDIWSIHNDNGHHTKHKDINKKGKQMRNNMIKNLIKSLKKRTNTGKISWTRGSKKGFRELASNISCFKESDRMMSYSTCASGYFVFYFVHLIRLFSGMYSNFCMFWSNTCPFQAFIIGSILVLQIRINNF